MLEVNLHTLERFINFAMNLDDVKSSDRSTAPILVLTRTTLLYQDVVLARTAIINALPTLAFARWIIFADFEKDAFFARNARSLGEFDGEIDQAPFWTWTNGETEYHYLILTRDTKDELFVTPVSNPNKPQPRLRTGRSSTTLRAVQHEAIEASRRDSKP